MKKIFAACFFSISLLAFAQQQDIVSYYNDPGKHERNRNIDVTHMLLKVQFVPHEGKVIGNVTHTFQCLQDAVDTVYLDGPDIQVSSATLDGKPITVRKNKTGIICETNLKSAYKSSHKLTLEYTANPEKGIYFIGWKLPALEDPKRQSRHQIWTQGQGVDNRYWIPMIDDRGDKFITEVEVRFLKDYNVLSNGALLENKDNKDGTKTWHYKLNNPHSGYLLMLAIDKYAVKKTATKNGTPIQFWYYPEHPEKLEPTSKYSERIIEFLEEEIGIPYQWVAYSQVMIQDFLYGAMENTSATTFGDFFWVDERAFLDRNYIGVNCHEATHQWFGDLITARNDADHWLQESFATFYPGLFVGSVGGPDETAWYFRGSMNGAKAADEKNNLPVRNSEAGSGRHYPKGASVIYMMQHVMGRDNFRRGIQLYLNRHKFTAVSTHDLETAMMDATGINMDWFFDQWIYRGGTPEFKVGYQKIATGTEFTVEQVHQQDQTMNTFTMPIDFAVYYTDGTKDKLTAIVDKQYQKVIIPDMKNRKIAFALFDEGSFLLKKVNVYNDFEALRLRLEKADHMLDRYDALIALSEFPMEKRKAALVKSYQQETYKYFKAEIVKQLVKDSTIDNEFIKAAYQSPIVEIRKAAFENSNVTPFSAPYFEKALTDSSYALIETVLLKLWNSPLYTDKKGQLLNPIKDLDGYLMGLKIRYLELGNEAYPYLKKVFIGNLIHFASDKYEFRCRINALQSLQRLNYCDTAVLPNAFSALLSWNSRLSNPAKEVLLYFKQQSACAALMRTEIEKATYSAKDKAKIKKLLDL